jgi:Cysteine rich repeat
MKMIRRIRLGFPSASMSMFLLLTMLSVSFSFVSYSAVRAEQGSVAKACVTDIREKCGGIQAGEGRIKDCIKTHFGELLKNCKTAVLKVAAIAKACRSDVKQHCADVKLGGGRIESCMQSHLADVSEPCKEALGKAAAPNE